MAGMVCRTHVLKPPIRFLRWSFIEQDRQKGELAHLAFWQLGQIVALQSSLKRSRESIRAKAGIPPFISTSPLNSRRK